MIQQIKKLLGQKIDEDDLAILEKSKSEEHEENYNEPLLSKEKSICKCGDEECACNHPGHVCHCTH